MNVKLLTENHLEFLSLKRGCTGSSEPTHFKMSHCWNLRVTAHMLPGLQLERTVVHTNIQYDKAYAVAS